MAQEPENLVLSILRDILGALPSQARDLSEIKADLRRQGLRIDELFESSTMALGLAGHADVRHETVQKQIEQLRERVERLEKQH
jgi:hypothetical protein